MCYHIQLSPTSQEEVDVKRRSVKDEVQLSPRTLLVKEEFQCSAEDAVMYRDRIIKGELHLNDESLEKKIIGMSM
jgi:hypothetical protein